MLCTHSVPQDDAFPTTRREPRRSSYDVAMKQFPIESANTKNISFLYSPEMSDLESKYLSISYFLIVIFAQGVFVVK